MKKTGLLLVLCAALSYAQQNSTAASDSGSSPIMTAGSFPFERVQTPTNADLYCAGFISDHAMANANYVAGGLNTPIASKFENGDLIYLSGGGYQAGQEYSVLRELVDPNEEELFEGQQRLLKSLGQPYSELGRIRVVDTRNKMAIAEVEFSCDALVPGDITVPYTEKTPISFHPPVRFDRYLPASTKTRGRIVLAKDFDSQLGTGGKVYLNVGANQGVKVGDYFRAVRPYSADLKDPVDSLSFKAAETEDTQKNQPSFEANFLTRTKGPAIRVEDMPRRAVGELVILSTTPTTATGMIVFALEEVHVGDQVELDEQ
jgi:hypothetical protein